MINFAAYQVKKGEKKIAEMLVYFLNGAYQFFNQGANFPCKADVF